MTTFARSLGSMLLAATIGSCALLGVGPVRAQSGDSGYYQLGPYRLMDSRPDGQTVDGLLSGNGPIVGGTTVEVQVAGRQTSGQEVVLGSVMATVAVTSPAERGFLVVYGCDQPTPFTANLTFGPGQTTSNSAITTLSSTGSLCVFTSATTNVIVDVSGTISDDDFTALAKPERFVDTRPGQLTLDGADNGIGVRAADSTSCVQIVGRSGIIQNTVAVIMNVTVVRPESNGFLTVFPEGAVRPLTSNLNYQQGQTLENLVAARVGENGRICLYVSAGTHLVVDVIGAIRGPFLDAPSRVYDSRIAGSSEFPGDGRHPAGSVAEIRLDDSAGRCGVLLNVAAVAPSENGFAALTISPFSPPPPTASLNYMAGSTISRGVIAPIRSDSIGLFTSADSHFVVDVVGYLVADGEDCLPGADEDDFDEGPPLE